MLCIVHEKGNNGRERYNAIELVAPGTERKKNGRLRVELWQLAVLQVHAECTYTVLVPLLSL